MEQSINQPAQSEKGGMIGLSIGLLVIGLVAGYFFGRGMGKNNVVEQTVTPIASLAVTDWQTYRNEKYGFSFQYPSDGKIQEDAKGIYVSQQEPGDPYGKFENIFTLNVKENGSIENEIKKIKDEVRSTQGSEGSLQIALEQEIILDGQSAVRLQLVGSETGAEYLGRVFVAKGNRVYSFFWTEYGNTTFDQMLSTFKFTSPSTSTVPGVVYTNSKYSFSLNMPSSWQGYSIVTDSWKGYVRDETKGDVPMYSGPELLVRHPLWSGSKPYQDIPIMIFTIDQWNLYLQGKFTVSAAPIAASEMGRNAKYVFALPPRWVGFTDALNQQEAQDIAQTFEAF